MPPLSRQDDLAQTFSSLNLEAASPAPSEAACVVLYHAACLLHTFTRPQNNSDQIEAHDASIVERPERLRAVLAGVHAAMARHPGRISLQTTEASLSLASAAVRAIHGPLHVTDDVHYASNLQDWLDNVDSRHKKGLSEIPEGFSQGDLYLAAGPKGSQLAIQGALGAACQAIDEVCADPDQGGIRFVAARPPGHHCGRDTPGGFCFVNNVAVALQHAHQAHDIDRVLIFDIDLHHGNGTQSLVWDINAKAAEAAASQSSSPKGKGRSNATSSKRPLRVFYGSLHDILSYPCETGDPQIVANASVRLAAHDQHICNVHLQPYSSQSQFHTQVYPSYQKDLFGAATEFCKATQADPSRTLIVVSAGMDACELEYTTMSRHNRRVPLSFYNRFARDIMGFATDADCYGIPSSTPTTCIPRVAAILEGGYSDAALMSGTASLLQGLSAREDENWFENQLEVKDIGLLEKASCINPPPPTVAKKLPAWALTAGQQLCHFLGEDREEWAKSQAKRAEIEARAAAAEPRALRERKGPKTYVEDEVDDTERPPPPTKPAQKPTKQRTPQPTPKPPKSKSEAPPAHAKAVEPVVVSQISLRGDSSMDQILNQAEAARKAATAVHSTSVFSQPPQRSSPQPQAQSPPPVQSSHFPAFEGEAPPPSPPARPSQEQQQPSRPPVREPKPLSAHEEARLEAARNQDGGIWANPFPSSAPSPPKKPTATPRGSLHASGASSAASAAPAPGQSEPRRRLNIISPTGSRESAMDQFASAVGRSWTQQEQDVFNPTFRTLGRQQQPQPQSRSQQSQPGSQSGGGVKFTFQGAPLRDPSQFGPWTPSDQ